MSARLLRGLVWDGPREQVSPAILEVERSDDDEIAIQAREYPAAADLVLLWVTREQAVELIGALALALSETWGAE